MLLASQAWTLLVWWDALIVLLLRVYQNKLGLSMNLASPSCGKTWPIGNYQDAWN